MTVRSISVKLSAEISSYVSNMRQAGTATKQFGSELTTLGGTSKAKFDGIVKGGAALGVGLVGAFAYAAKSAADFDKQMSELGAVAGATGAQMGQLRAAAINAGQATVFSAGEAAQAETELAKAGLSTSDILGGALTGALSLASAGSLDLATAATDVATALNIFQLKGSQTSHVADLLAAGANKSAADVKTLSDSLNQGGLVAAQTGLSIEDTVGTLAAFAQAGLKGSDAGTSLKTMLQALQAPSGKTADLMAQLGINAYDASGKFIGITKLAQQLQTQLGGLTQAQRDAALAQIFGTDAVRSADILYQQGAKGLQGWIDGVNQTGAAADVARKKMDNLSGDLENLKGSIETLTISTGSGLQGALRGVTQAATGAVNSFSVLPASLTKYGTEAAGLAGGLLLVAAGTAKAKQKSDELGATLRGMGPAGTKAASALSSLTVGAGKFAAAMVIAQAASAAFGTTISPQTSQVEKDLTQLALTGKATGVELQHLSYDIGSTGTGAMAKFGNAVSGTIEGTLGLGNVFDESMTHANERLAAIDQGLSALVSGGKAQTAAVAFQQLAAQAKAGGISVSDLSAHLPNYTAALQSAKDAASGTASATGKATTGIAGTGTAASDASSAIDDFKSSLDMLNGGALDLASATDAYQASLDDATASLKANGKTLDAGTASGRSNRAALRQIVTTAEDLSTSTLTMTGSQSKANGVLEAGRQKFIQTAMKMGDTKKQAEALADQLFKIPKSTSTQINTPGLSAAVAGVSGLVTQIRNLPGKKTFTLHILTSGSIPQGLSATGGQRVILGQRDGGIHTHAETGLLNAGIYSTASPARYAFAEPATGGEGFVPKRGNYARSTGILDTMASWYGGRFVPGAGGAGGGGAGAGYTYAPTYIVQPQRADFTVQDFQAMQARSDVQMRLGRNH